MSPYRTSSKRHEAAPRRRERLDDSVTSMFALFWLVSGARVVLAIAAHEVFGTEATLALLVVVIVPFATGRSVRTG